MPSLVAELLDDEGYEMASNFPNKFLNLFSIGSVVFEVTDQLRLVLWFEIRRLICSFLLTLTLYFGRSLYE